VDVALDDTAEVLGVLADGAAMQAHGPSGQESLPELAQVDLVLGETVTGQEILMVK
jgi:hypothetical protein